MEKKRRQCFYTVSLRACSRGDPILTLGTPYLVPGDLEAVPVRLPAHRPTGGQSANGHWCQVATGTGLRVVNLRRATFEELVGLREAET